MGTREHQTYEVQVYENGRWQVQARYPHEERVAAIADGKTIGGGVAVRVILEDYDPSSGRHRESLIYRNKIEPQRKPKARAKVGTSWADMAVSSDGRVGYSRDDMAEIFEDYVPREAKKAKVNTVMFMAIVLTILGIGVASGGAAAGLLALLIKGFGVALTAQAHLILLAGMFVIVFLMAVSTSLGYYRARFDLNPFGGEEPQRPKVKKSQISKQMEKAASDIDKVPPVAHTQVPAAEEPFSMYDGYEDESEGEESAPETPAVPQEEEPEFSEAAEEVKSFLILFLGTCLGALKGPGSDAANLNRFALNLFMTGAVLRLSEENALSDFETDQILVRLLEMMGAKTPQAERFALEYEKYLEDPRNATLFEESGKIASRQKSGDQTASLEIRETIETWVNWKRKEAEETNPNLLSIMFTDMVGSTDLATRHGDYAAQEVLKAHDLIVRSALVNFDGKEIKHLGDGIMASFKSHEDAIEAAIEIQKRVEGNNNADPEFPFHLRIGINAGEPIKKGNDLFGTSVQLAARLCSIPGSDCVYVSGAFKDLFGDKPVFTFLDQGALQLKGFEEPQFVYQVDWAAELLEYPEDETDETGEEGQSGEKDDGFTAEVAFPVAPQAPDMMVEAPQSQEPQSQAPVETAQAADEPAKSV